MDFDDIVKIVDQVKVLEARLAAVEAERDAARAGEAEKEEKDCLQVIAERDEHEERLNRIFSALGMDEAESEWSSANDPAALAIEKAEELRAALLTAQAGEARAVDLLKRIHAMNKWLRDNELTPLPDDAVYTGAEYLMALKTPALDWLTQQRREAVAAWIEKEATKCRQQNGECYDRGVDCMLREAAALRAGEVPND